MLSASSRFGPRSYELAFRRGCDWDRRRAVNSSPLARGVRFLSPTLWKVLLCGGQHGSNPWAGHSWGFDSSTFRSWRVNPAGLGLAWKATRRASAGVRVSRPPLCPGAVKSARSNAENARVPRRGGTSGKADACKASRRRFESGPRLSWSVSEADPTVASRRRANAGWVRFPGAPLDTMFAWQPSPHPASMQLPCCPSPQRMT
jgi:hypothetical protein